MRGEEDPHTDAVLQGPELLQCLRLLERRGPEGREALEERGPKHVDTDVAEGGGKAAAARFGAATPRRTAFRSSISSRITA